MFFVDQIKQLCRLGLAHQDSQFDTSDLSRDVYVHTLRHVLQFLARSPKLKQLSDPEEYILIGRPMRDGIKDPRVRSVLLLLFCESAALCICLKSKNALGQKKSAVGRGSSKIAKPVVLLTETGLLWNHIELLARRHSASRKHPFVDPKEVWSQDFEIARRMSEMSEASGVLLLHESSVRYTHRSFSFKVVTDYRMIVLNGGVPLSRWIREPGISEHERYAMLHSIFNIVRTMHERSRIAHNDLTLSNILVNIGEPVVIDFGLAGALDARRNVLGGTFEVATVSELHYVLSPIGSVLEYCARKIGDLYKSMLQQDMATWSDTQYLSCMYLVYMQGLIRQMFERLPEIEGSSDVAAPILRGVLRQWIGDLRQQDSQWDIFLSYSVRAGLNQLFEKMRAWAASENEWRCRIAREMACCYQHLSSEIEGCEDELETYVSQPTYLCMLEWNLILGYLLQKLERRFYLADARSYPGAYSIGWLAYRQLQEEKRLLPQWSLNESYHQHAVAADLFAFCAVIWPSVILGQMLGHIYQQPVEAADVIARVTAIHPVIARCLEGHEISHEEVNEALLAQLDPPAVFRPVSPPASIGRASTGLERCDAHLRNASTETVPFGISTEATVVETPLVPEKRQGSWLRWLFEPLGYTAQEDRTLAGMMLDQFRMLPMRR